MVQHQHQEIGGEEIAQLSAIAESRSQIYWFLSAFFLNAPTAAELNDLKAQFAARLRNDADDAEPILAQLAGAINVAADLDQLAHDLSVEFTRLFGGLKNNSGLPPPYESVHRESRLIGDTTRAVIDAYQDAGFGDIDSGAGPQDHIGVELKFLALLCYEESRAWSDNDITAAGTACARQFNFLEHHALAWIPAYCDDLSQKSQQDYYRLVGRLTQHVLARDREILRALQKQYGVH